MHFAGYVGTDEKRAGLQFVDGSVALTELLVLFEDLRIESGTHDVSLADVVPVLLRQVFLERVKVERR